MTEGLTYTSSQEIANCYNSFFTTIAKDLTAYLPPPEFNITNKLTFCILKLPTVNAQTVKKIISKLKNSKGIGLDNISMNMIKTLNKSESFVLTLTSIINFSFESSTFPTVWKSAKVVPILKSGEANSMDNYRPISVLNCLSKIIERIVFNTIYASFTEENLFHKLQSGFRHNHSTATAMIYLIDTIYQDMDENKITGALFLDLRKAFDTINHTILLSTFKLLNPNDQMLN